MFTGSSTKGKTQRTKTISTAASRRFCHTFRKKKRDTTKRALEQRKGREVARWANSPPEVRLSTNPSPRADFINCSKAGAQITPVSSAATKLAPKKQAQARPRFSLGIAQNTHTATASSRKITTMYPR